MINEKNKESFVDIFLRECLIVYLELPMQFFFERVGAAFVLLYKNNHKFFLRNHK